MNPLLLEFPTEFETERLLIRWPLPDDASACYEAQVTSHHELKQWLPFAQQPPQLDDVKANCRKAWAAFITRDDLRLHLFEKSSGRFIGSSGLHRINWSARSFEIGYWLHSEFAGRGYMTEAVVGIIAFAERELGARRLEIRCDPNNFKSRAIAERLNFTLEGILAQSALSPDGQSWRDTCVYAKITAPCQ